MGKNVIVSEQTVRDLLEAHASLSAWYYELWAALRAGTAPRPPDDAARAAFVERLASDFPEIAISRRDNSARGTGALNGGGSTVKVQTSSGAIHLRRGPAAQK